MNTHSEHFIHSSDVPWEHADEGIERQILGYDGELMMVRVVFKRGAIGVLHKHVHRQVSYVEAGSFELEIDGEKRILRQGDSYFVPSNLIHGAVALEDGSLIDVFTPAREDFLK
jgi:quercetin dioxygenase-like cupin family protein